MPESLVLRIDETYSIEVVDEPTYRFHFDDNRKRYDRKELFGDRHLVISCHGVVCKRNSQIMASVIFGADGGASGVHERSVVLASGVAFVAVGRYIACLQLPDLITKWVREVDPATCFGIHFSADRLSIVSHGELEISRLTLAGDVLWQSAGRDIFSGDVLVDEAMIHAQDFNGDVYHFDLETGKLVASSA